jgi:hypothetical protein
MEALRGAEAPLFHVAEARHVHVAEARLFHATFRIILSFQVIFTTTFDLT